MHGFERIDIGGMGGVHDIDVGRCEIAGELGGVVILDAKVLHFEAADRRGHPAILVAVIVDAAELADFPADGHALEDRVLENEIAGVVAFGEEEVFFEGFGTDGMVEDIVLDGFESEVALGDSGETFDPVDDGELLDDELFLHGRKIITPKRSG